MKYDLQRCYGAGVTYQQKKNVNSAGVCHVTISYLYLSDEWNSVLLQLHGSRICNKWEVDGKI